MVINGSVFAYNSDGWGIFLIFPFLGKKWKIVKCTRKYSNFSINKKIRKQY
jgi:hypothetical protein